MKRLFAVWLLLCGLWSAALWAGEGPMRTLYTPPLGAGDISFMQCTAVNLGSRPTKVSVDLVDNGGYTVFGALTTVLGPGEAISNSTTEDFSSATTRLFRCVISYRGAKNQVRGAFQACLQASSVVVGPPPEQLGCFAVEARH